MNASVIGGRFSFVRGLSLSDYLTLANGIGGAGAVLAVLGYMANGQLAWLVLAMSLLSRSAWRWTFSTGAWRARAASRRRWARISIRWRTSCRSASRRRRSGSRSACAAAGTCSRCCSWSRARSDGWPATTSRRRRSSDDSGKVRYFEGVPVTGSLLVVAVLAASALTGHLGAQPAARRAPARAVRPPPAVARLPGRRLRHGQQAAAHSEAVTAAGRAARPVRRCRRRRRRRGRSSAGRRPASRRRARGSSGPGSASARAPTRCLIRTSGALVRSIAFQNASNDAAFSSWATR